MGMSVIILLNLLIAMMSTTYTKIEEASTMEWRLDFARLVLKLELECGWLHNPPKICGRQLFTPWDMHAGEMSAGRDKYVIYFRHVEANVEGGGIEGGKAVFDDIGADNEIDVAGGGGAGRGVSNPAGASNAAILSRPSNDDDM